MCKKVYTYIADTSAEAKTKTSSMMLFSACIAAKALLYFNSPLKLQLHVQGKSVYNLFYFIAFNNVTYLRTMRNQ